MSFIVHIFAAVGAFFASIFGGVPQDQVMPPVATTTQSTTTHKELEVADSNNSSVSFNGKPIPGVDTATFKLIPGPGNVQTDYAHDKNHVYLGTAVVQGADVKTFTVIAGPLKATSVNAQYYYAKDKDHVFVNDLVVANADPATFAYVKNQTTYNAADKNHRYLDGTVVK